MNERIIEFISNAPEPGPVPSPEYVDAAAQTGDPILWMLIVIITIATLSILTTISINKNQMIKNGFEAVAKRINTHKMILAIILSILLLGAGQIIALSCNKTKAFAEDEPENKITAVVDYQTGKITFDEDLFQNSLDVSLGIFAFDLNFNDGSIIENAKWTIKSGENILYEGSAGDTEYHDTILYMEVDENIPIEYSLETDFDTAQSLVGKTASSKIEYAKTTDVFDVAVDTKDISLAQISIKEQLEAAGWELQGTSDVWVMHNVNAFKPLNEVIKIWNDFVKEEKLTMPEDTRFVKWATETKSKFTVENTSYIPELQDISYIYLHQNKPVLSNVTITDDKGNVTHAKMKKPSEQAQIAELKFSVDANSKINIVVDGNVGEKIEYPILYFNLEAYEKGNTLHQGVTLKSYDELKKIKGTTNPAKAGIEVQYTPFSGPVTKVTTDDNGYFELPVDITYDGVFTIVDPDDPECIFTRTYRRISADIDFGTLDLTKYKLIMSCDGGKFVENTIPDGWHKQADGTYARNFYKGSYVENGLENWGKTAADITGMVGDPGKGWYKWEYEKSEGDYTILENDFNVKAIFVEWLYNMITEVQDLDGNKMGDVIYVGDKNKIRNGCKFQHFLDGIGIFYHEQLVCVIGVNYYPQYVNTMHAHDWITDSGLAKLTGMIMEPLNFYPTKYTTELTGEVIFEQAPEWTFNDSDIQTLLNCGWTYDGARSHYVIKHYDYVETAKIEMYMNLLGISAHQEGKTFKSWHVERSEDWETMTVSPVWE